MMAGSTGKRLVKGFGIATGLLVLIAVVLMLYQRIGETRDSSLYPVSGTHYNVGDVSLYMDCHGNGTTTVVFSSGMGNPAESWRPLERLLETDFKVCSYDRDGLGLSGDSGYARDAAVASARLARLLDLAGIEGPIVLVGHSYGALIARVFTADYPGRVGALVLLDSSHEDMMQRFPPNVQQGFRDLLDGFQFAPWLNVFGIARAFDLFLPVIDGLDGEDRARSLARLNTVSHMNGTAEEAAGWDRSSIPARVLREKGFGALPLDVFVAGDWPDEMMPSWLAMQRELAALSSVGQFYFVEEANHPQIGMDVRYIGEVADVIRSRAAKLSE